MNVARKFFVAMLVGGSLLGQSASASAGPLAAIQRHPVLAVLAVGGGALLEGAKGYKEKCMAGGGVYDLDSQFHAGQASLSTLFYPFPCPLDPASASTTHYAVLAAELPEDLALFKSTKKLQSQMKAAGKGVLPKGCATHHIVPENEDKGRNGQSSDSDEARDLLEQCGIDINDADNGVFLPNRHDPSESMCKGAYHPKLHTKRYFEAVLGALTEGFGENGCAGVREALRAFGEDLKDGERLRYQNQRSAPSALDASSESSPAGGLQ